YGNVCRTFMQGWHLDWEDVQAIEQIRAESTVGNRRLEVSIRRGNHPYVDANRAAAANSLELALLQNAKQRHLRICGQLADFVEKEYPHRANFPCLRCRAPVNAPRS